MVSIKKSGLLAAAAFVLLARVFSAAMVSPDQNAHHVVVPDGGSAVVYVVGAGFICLVAILLRLRLAKKAS